MKISRIKLIIFIIILISIIWTIIFAADQLYRFMHNDHNALILGEIVRIDEKFVSMRVEKCIVSAKDLNANSPKKQIELKNVDIMHPFDYIYGTPEVGDFALASLEKT